MPTSGTAVLYVCCLVCIAWSACLGGVDCIVVWSDANDAVDLRPVEDRTWQRALMVGSRLSFVLYSDQARVWEGGCLLVVDGQAGTGTLSARDYNDLTLDWEGSRYAQAGPHARVWRMAGWLGPSRVSGFQFIGSDRAEPGNWFVIDYQSNGLGVCQVLFFDYAVSFVQPVKVFLFEHVVSRDLDDDGLVCLRDLAVIGRSWRGSPEGHPSVDLDQDGLVGPLDLAIFLRHWLDRSR